MADRKRTKLKGKKEGIISNLQIGELILQSSKEPIQELINFAIFLLATKEVKEYLFDLAQRKMKGMDNYVG